MGPARRLTWGSDSPHAAKAILIIFEAHVQEKLLEDMGNMYMRRSVLDSLQVRWNVCTVEMRADESMLFGFSRMQHLGSVLKPKDAGIICQMRQYLYSIFNLVNMTISLH